MSINEVSAVTDINNYVIENLGKETQQSTEKVKSLFSEKFYNGGTDSAEAIASEVERLEQYIDSKQEEYNQTYNYLKLTNTELNRLNQELEKEILEVVKQAEKDEQIQKAFIQRAIDETNEQYMNGEIEKGDMPGVLSSKIAKYFGLDSSVLQASNKLNSKRARITSLTSKIATIIDKANCIESESKLAQGTLVMMKNLMGKMSLSKSNSSTGASEKPVYTPTKQALVDELAENIRGLVGEGTYDKNSMNNPQLVKLKEFLGLDNQGKLNEYGVPENSMLNRMKDEGFTEKEAVYAINWIFDNVNMKYEVGGQWSVPYGHGTDAKETYSALLSQTEKLWGAEGTQEADTTTTATKPTATTTTPTTTTTTSSSPTSDVKRTDPIGYSDGDVTYEFVIDRNKDDKFNDKSEFLGANNGIRELKDLDSNNDGTIDTDELSANENIFVLITDHKTGSHKFKSAASEIKSIDLTSLSSKNWTNINNNKLKNTFTVNTVKGTAQGYQTDDDNYYLDKSYNGVTNSEIIVTVDEEAMNKAQNIFNSIQTMDNEEAESISSKAAIDVKTTQKEVNSINNDLKTTAGQAQSQLTNATRPETEEERLEREKKEEAEAQERIEKLKAAQEAQEKEEAQKAEEAKKAKEEKQAQEAQNAQEA